MSSSKSSSEDSVSEAQDTAIATTVFSRLRIPTSFKLTSVLIVVCLGLIFSISSDIAVVIGHPTVFLIPFAGFMLWAMAFAIVSGSKELLKPDKEYSSLLQESTEYEALVRETLSEIPPSWRSQPIVVSVTFSLPICGLLVYSWVTGVLMIEDALILGVIWFFWFVFVTSLQSCFRLNGILISHVKVFFANDKFSLHRFQERFLSLALKEEQTSINSSTKSKRKPISVKNTSSHYNLRNNSTKLIRKTRGVITTFIGFGIELFLFLALLNVGTTTGGVLNFGLNFTFVFVMTQLILTLSFLLLNYAEAELAIHSVLDKSKRNLVELCDLMIVKTIIERRDSLGGLKNDLEVSQNLFSYFSKLPTWTVDSRIALSIGGGVVIQIVAIVIAIFNFLSS